MSNTYFQGVQTLYGSAAFERIQQSHFMVVGLGGVGSWTVEALVRSGALNISLVDLDDICESNINRQLPAHSQSVGQFKAEALAARCHLISPSCQVKPILDFYSESTSESLLATKPDVVVDAIDSLASKTHLIAQCYWQKIPLVVSGSAGGRKDAMQFICKDLAKTFQDPLLFRVRKKLRRDYNINPKKFRIPTVFTPEKTQEVVESEINHKKCDFSLGSVVHMTATLGFMLAQQAIEMVTPKGEA